MEISTSSPTRTAEDCIQIQDSTDPLFVHAKNTLSLNNCHNVHRAISDNGANIDNCKKVLILKAHNIILQQCCNIHYATVTGSARILHCKNITILHTIAKKGSDQKYIGIHLVDAGVEHLVVHSPTTIRSNQPLRKVTRVFEKDGSLQMEDVTARFNESFKPGRKTLVP